jgi:hypothetical protein
MASLRIARLIVYPAPNFNTSVEYQKWEIRARAKSCAIYDGLGFLSLETDIEFKMVDVSIKLLSGLGDLVSRVPLLEALICCT